MRCGMFSKGQASLLVCFTRHGRGSSSQPPRISEGFCRTRTRPLFDLVSSRGTYLNITHSLFRPAPSSRRWDTWPSSLALARPTIWLTLAPLARSLYRLSDRIAYFLGTHGPTLTVETACSSSLVALTLAVNAIRDGSCDVAIVPAVNVATREYELALQAAGVISTEGQCRPFAEDASGTLRCECSTCMIVCSMEWAKRHGYRDTIKSVIVNSTIGSAGADPLAAQGSGRVYESPNVFGMAEMIRLCHEQVGLPLEKIAYVEAHGALLMSSASSAAPSQSRPPLTFVRLLYDSHWDESRRPCGAPGFGRSVWDIARH